MTQPTLTNQQLERFLIKVERRAYQMAYMAVGNEADALDLVQESMIKLAQHYADKNEEALAPLFHRILQNKITDHYRKQSLHRWLFPWKEKKGGDDEGEFFEAEDLAVDEQGPAPDQALEQQQLNQRIMLALKQLPFKQQQAFMLRAWEGYDTKQTAEIMGVSEGSIKTHYSRAREHMKVLLNEIQLTSQEAL